MKYLLVIAVVLLVVWLLRGRGRLGAGSERPAAAKNPAGPEEMVRCAHCAVHLPRLEALAGPQGGVYCSEAHRAAGPAS